MSAEGIGPFVEGGAVESLRAGDPHKVGVYRLLGRLGAGGMGQVFLGESPGGRKVAVKLVLPQHAADGEFRQRFAREVAAARQVGGFHTAPVVDADPDADPPWMATAYIPGPSLDAAIRQDGPLEPGAVRRLGAALAEGLTAVHACGLVHRDLKPGNIILADDGPRIIDFGIARPVDATALTSSGVLIGTFSFMSPEQVHGEHVDGRSDIFALGGVLAYAATGRGPFDAATIPAIVHRIASQSPDLQGLEGPLREIISACLAKDPAGRPSLTGLTAFLSGTAGPGVVAGSEAASRPSAKPAPAPTPVSELPTATASGRGLSGQPPVLVQRPGAQPVRAARSRKTRVPLIIGASFAGVTAAALAVSFTVIGSDGNQPGSANCAPAAASSTAAGAVVLVYLDGGQASPGLLCDIERTAGVRQVRPLSATELQSLPPALRLYDGQASPVLVVRVSDGAAAQQLARKLTGHTGVRGVRAT